MAPSLKADRAAVAFKAARFDGLAAGLGEALVCLFFAFLLDLATVIFCDLEVRLADAWRDAPLAFGLGDLEDFFRVFLDIRLPFVAFRGSIIAVLRETGIRSVAGRVRSAADYAQNHFAMPLARLLLVAFDRRSADNICWATPAFRFAARLKSVANAGIEGMLANRSFGGVRDLIFALGLEFAAAWCRNFKWAARGGQTGSECQTISAG